MIATGRDEWTLNSVTLLVAVVLSPVALVAACSSDEASAGVAGTSAAPDAGTLVASEASAPLAASDASSSSDASKGEPPDTEITTRPPAITSKRVAEFAFTSTVHDASFECSLDQAAFAVCAVPLVQTVADGLHSLRVAAIAGGVADPTPAEATWTVDTTPPHLTLSAPSGSLDAPVATATFTADEAGASFRCSADERAGAPCTSPFLLEITAGPHTLNVTAVDALGNEAAPVTATWTLRGGGLPDSTPFCTDGAVATACPGGPAGQDGRYILNPPRYEIGTDVTRDYVTDLRWERSPLLTPMSIADAKSYCSARAAAKLGGVDGWRVPTRLELLSIVDAGRSIPAFDPIAFPDIPTNSVYWSSTLTPNGSEYYAFTANYAVGTSLQPDTLHNVRCVAGAAFSGALALSPSGTTVIDARTRLRWEGATAASLSWGAAVAYCDQLDLDAFTDWRVPSVKELYSIVSEVDILTTISPLFSSRPATSFWSSTPVQSQPDKSHAVNFAIGIGAGVATPLDTPLSVRCVRGS